MRLTLFSRLILGYLAVFILVLAVSIYAVFQLDRFNVVTRSVLDTDNRVLDYEKKLADALLSQIRYERKFFITKDAAFYDQFLLFKTDFEQYLDDVLSLADAEASGLLENARAHYQSYHELVDRGAINTGTGTALTTTNLQGILTLRSQNMGWGQTAQRLGFKLGPVVSGLKAANQGLEAPASSTSGSGIVNAGNQAVESAQSGVVTGSGRPVGRSATGASGRSREGEGIVSGSGRPLGLTGGITTGRGRGYGISGDPRNSGQAKGHNR